MTTDLNNAGPDVGNLLWCGEVVLALAHPALAGTVGTAGQHLALRGQEQAVGFTRGNLAKPQKR